MSEEVTQPQIEVPPSAYVKEVEKIDIKEAQEQPQPVAVESKEAEVKPKKAPPAKAEAKAQITDAPKGYPDIVGQKIASVRLMDKKELEDFGWPLDAKVSVIVLANTAQIFPQADGNGIKPGILIHALEGTETVLDRPENDAILRISEMAKIGS